MRVGSGKIARAFLDGRKAKIKNTMTDGEAIYLHGNKIVWKGDDNVIHFTLSGWNTVTTRDRINQVFRVAGITLAVCQHKFEPQVYNYNTRQTEKISSRLPYAISDFI